jgi:hypothetical protein
MSPVKIRGKLAAPDAAFFASDIVGLFKQRREIGISMPVMGVTGVTAGVSPEVLRDAAGTLVHGEGILDGGMTRRRPTKPGVRSRMFATRGRTAP